MSDPNPPQAEPDSPRPVSEPAADRPAGRGNSSAGRIALVVVPVVLLAALVGFGWALGWHEPLVSAFFTPELAPVRGKITYKGEPVTIGSVATWPVSRMGESALGSLGPDGTFELMTNAQEGATVGEHRLMVMSMTSGFPPQPITPARYAQAATTPLRITVTSDAEKNVFEFNLTDEEGK